MWNTNLLFLIRCTVFLGLMVASSAAPVEIVGTLQNVDGVPIEGTITVVHEGLHLTVTSHEVEESGLFHFTIDADGELVLHAASPRHASDERVIPAETAGVVAVDFMLPLGQDVQIRVVDAQGQGVPGATLRVRYHEPDKPVRRVAFDHEEEVTDGDGHVLLREVGIEVPFVVDVLAPHYPPISSERTTLAAGELQMEDIVLEEPGASVVVELVDQDDSPVSSASVTLLADPAGLTSEAHGSWLHHQAFRQRAVTSALGNARFTGVPSGRIIVRVKTLTDSIEQRAVAFSNEELRLRLVLP